MSEELTNPDSTIADTAVPPAPPAPTVIHVKSDGNGRTPAWVLVGVSLGFLLPMCACGFLMVTFFFSLALAGSASPATGSGGFGDAVAIVRVEGAITHSDDTQSALGAVSGTVINDLRTAVADDEVYHETVKGHFYHLKYPIVSNVAPATPHVAPATSPEFGEHGPLARANDLPPGRIAPRPPIGLPASSQRHAPTLATCTV